MALRKISDNMEDELKETYDEIKDLIHCYNKYIKAGLKSLKNAKTVEEFMSAKKTIMFDIMSMMPIGGEYCPYCAIYGRDSCNDCPYGKKHGLCNEKSSDYHRLVEAEVAFRRALDRY